MRFTRLPVEIRADSAETCEHKHEAQFSSIYAHSMKISSDERLLSVHLASVKLTSLNKSRTLGRCAFGCQERKANTMNQRTTSGHLLSFPLSMHYPWPRLQQTHGGHTLAFYSLTSIPATATGLVLRCPESVAALSQLLEGRWGDACLVVCGEKRVGPR